MYGRSEQHQDEASQRAHDANRRQRPPHNKDRVFIAGFAEAPSARMAGVIVQGNFRSRLESAGLFGGVEGLAGAALAVCPAKALESSGFENLSRGADPYASAPADRPPDKDQRKAGGKSHPAQHFQDGPYNVCGFRHAQILCPLEARAVLDGHFHPCSCFRRCGGGPSLPFSVNTLKADAAGCPKGRTAASGRLPAERERRRTPTQRWRPGPHPRVLR